MFDDQQFRFIRVYWLSEFADRFEIWMAKRASIVASDSSLDFTAYLVWPVEVAEDSPVSITSTNGQLVLRTDWFPEEDFPLKVFSSQDQEVILMSTYERETIFIYLEK